MGKTETALINTLIQYTVRVHNVLMELQSFVSKYNTSSDLVLSDAQ
jgi:hypothetical protein